MLEKHEAVKGSLSLDPESRGKHFRDRLLGRCLSFSCLCSVNGGSVTGLSSPESAFVSPAGFRPTEAVLSHTTKKQSLPSLLASGGAKGKIA